MRDPNNIIVMQNKDKVEETLTLNNVPEYDIEDYDLNVPKVFAKFISNVEKIVRNSFEYKQLVSFLRNYMNMNQCSFYKYVSNEENFNIKIHIHHEPITLYDIVVAVYNKRSALREPITEDMVAKEVMYNHYKLRVGLIPLAETVHELVHNQYIFVPTTAVFGKYWEFVDIYHDWIEPETLETLQKIEAISKKYSMDQANNILSRNLIYVNTDDSIGKVDLDEVRQLLQERINIANSNPM